MIWQVQGEVEKLEKTRGSRILVVGSGPAGVELATTMADRLKALANVELISTGNSKALERSSSRVDTKSLLIVFSQEAADHRSVEFYWNPGQVYLPNMHCIRLKRRDSVQDHKSWKGFLAPIGNLQSGVLSGKASLSHIIREWVTTISFCTGVSVWTESLMLTYFIALNLFDGDSNFAHERIRENMPMQSFVFPWAQSMALKHYHRFLNMVKASRIWLPRSVFKVRIWLMWLLKGISCALSTSITPFDQQQIDAVHYLSLLNWQLLIMSPRMGFSTGFHNWKALSDLKVQKLKESSKKGAASGLPLHTAQVQVGDKEKRVPLDPIYYYTLSLVWKLQSCNWSKMLTWRYLCASMAISFAKHSDIFLPIFSSNVGSGLQKGSFELSA